MIKYLKEQIPSKIKGKICLLRLDLNVERLDSFFGLYRFNSVLPTINFLLKNKNKIIILSHRGRPEGKDKKLSLKPFVKLLEKNLKTKVTFFEDFDWDFIKKEIKERKNQNIFLIENLRFLKEEEKNNFFFAKKIASLGDFYVNDAFAVCHRKNASVVALAKILPSFGGLLLQKEINNLNAIMKEYVSPLTVIIGGAKIKDKLGVIDNFFNKADYFLLGGGPANTFLKAEGMDIGKSIYDADYVFSLKKYLNSSNIILPWDVKMDGLEILDIGLKTRKEYMKIICKSRTIIWNGPLGYFEKKGFEKGTLDVWKSIASIKNAKAVIGGGETIASLDLLPSALRKKILSKKNIFISTGGGAMLYYLSGKKLPGIEVLKGK